nr:serine carboxypeptidase-like 31 [Tanacetum cinerariifolium]
MMPRILGGYDPCLDDYAKGYYNKLEVQKALHVNNGLQLKNWSISVKVRFDKTQLEADSFINEVGDTI